jgi:uncharacterized membrane protein
MTTLLTSTTIGYPFLMSAGLALGRPRLVAVVIGVMLLIPGALAWRSGYRSQALWRLADAALAMSFLAVAAIVNRGHVFRLGPALANVVMLFSFGRTLVWGPSIVEVIARVRHGGNLPPGAQAYCRRLTLVWCVFFALNASFITWLAFYASLAWWTVYTGVLAYLLAGALFMGELAYRRRHFADAAT